MDVTPGTHANLAAIRGVLLGNTTQECNPFALILVKQPIHVIYHARIELFVNVYQLRVIEDTLLATQELLLLTLILFQEVLNIVYPNLINTSKAFI